MTEIPSYKHTGMISSLAWSADGSQLFSASYDGAIRAWRKEKTEIVRESPVLGENDQPTAEAVWAMDWSATSGGLVASERAGIVVYHNDHVQAVIGEGISAVELKCCPTNALVALREMTFTDDGKQVVPRLRIRDLKRFSDAPILDSDVFSDPDLWTYDFAWSPNGMFLAVLAAGDVSVWLSGQRPPLQQGLPIGPWANAIAWLNDDELAVAYGDGNVRLFDRQELATSKYRAKSKAVLEAHEASVTSISIGMAGKQFATVDLDGCVCRWNESKELISKTTIDMDAHSGLKIRFNPHFPILAFARGAEVGLLLLDDTGKTEKPAVEAINAPISPLDKILEAAGLSDHGKLTSDEVVELWRIQTVYETAIEGLLFTKQVRRIARATQELNSLLCDAIRETFVAPTREEIIALEDIEIGANRTDDRETTRHKICSLLAKAATDDDIQKRTIAICAYALFSLGGPNEGFKFSAADEEAFVKWTNTLDDTELRRHLKTLSSGRPAVPNKIADTLAQAAIAIGAGLQNAKARPRQTAQADENQHPATESFALVMKGGGLKGLACIGALRELQRFYDFDLYVGTSAGAIIAALLGAGYTPDEMETILRQMSFAEFLSERAKIITNLFFHGGLFRGTKLTDWIDTLLAVKLQSPTRVEFRQLPHHVRIYACRRDTDALIFDSQQSPRMSVAYAVRCSVAIPLFFTPEREQGLYVFDGGMRHNYPVKKLLEQTPNKKFLGLYLGDPIYTPSKPNLLRDLLSISTEATDVEALRIYNDETIVIDPKPVSTLDFSLSSEEKTFLLSQGRAAALQFLQRKGHIKQIDLDEATRLAEQHKVAAVTARRKRTFRSKLISRSMLIFVLLLLLLWKFGGAGLWQLATDGVGDVHAAVCKLLSVCSKPKFDWVAGGPASVSHAIAGDTPFIFPDLQSAPATGAVVGSQRYGSPKATCAPLIQNAWKLHDGEVILDDDPLIQNGWTSPSWVGEPEPPDWNKFDKIAETRFGFTPGFANSRCSKGQHCTLSPVEIKTHSQEIEVPVEECARMRMAEINYSPGKNSLTVWIRGKANHQSVWTVTVPLETYKAPTPEQ
jgi:predicted acylesterase/phospholipase RssA/WD40 repeat protein